MLKNTSYDTLAEAIRSVQRGQRLLAPELVHHVLDEYRRLAQERLRQEVGLSEQEIEVLRLLADGATSRDIADRLFWSEVTAGRKIQISPTSSTPAIACRQWPRRSARADSACRSWPFVAAPAQHMIRSCPRVIR
ncbi:MAG: LuxR C-terminal-related transcriptional regulator [Kouleothrix sp.]